MNCQIKSMNELTVIISETCDIDTRLDVFLTKRLNGYSRNSVQHMIENGNVTLFGESIKSNYRIREGDNFRVAIPAPVEVLMLPEAIPLDIVYEDADIIVINKPQGMVVHPAVGNPSGTLANALLYHCSNSLSGINGELRPGIVHRLDKDTSGLIVAAKNDTAHRDLSEQFKEHKVTRVYHALVCGNVKQDTGIIDKPIGRNFKDRKKMAICDFNGKEAITRYTVIERFNKHTLIKAELQTGRTHQIRVHMASLGYPVYGDMVYGNLNYPPHIKGQVLHAKVLGFGHPAAGCPMLFETPLPDYFIEILDELR